MIRALSARFSNHFTLSLTAFLLAGSTGKKSTLPPRKSDNLNTKNDSGHNAGFSYSKTKQTVPTIALGTFARLVFQSSRLDSRIPVVQSSRNGDPSKIKVVFAKVI
jgi:hypothetical protein